MPTPRGLPSQYGERAYTRAYARALRELKDQHRTEFEALLLEHLPKAKAEIEQLVAAGHPPGTRLRRGNPPAGATVTERLDVARCPVCIDRHDAGHICPACGVDAATLTAGRCVRCGASETDRGRCVVDRPDIGKRFVLEAHAFPAPRRPHRSHAEQHASVAPRRLVEAQRQADQPAERETR